MGALFRFIGRWSFRACLTPLAGFLFMRAVVVAAIERVMGWNREKFADRVLDRLLTPDSVVLATLTASFFHPYEFEADGAGFSEQQIPKLWGTCRALAEKLGCPPPDAIHLSVEPGDTMAWSSKVGEGPLRRHICLSLLDLRILSHDAARAVIAHEIVHAGFGHGPAGDAQSRVEAVIELAVLGLPLYLPLYVARAFYRLGCDLGAHDNEREADRRAAEVVGKNHMHEALNLTHVQGRVLDRVFAIVMARALEGPRAPMRLAEATEKLYRSFAFARAKHLAWDHSQHDGAAHPSLPNRVAGVDAAPERAGIGRGASFLEAYPELVVIEELLTKTYFPETPTHTRSDASQLKRKALAARLARGRPPRGG